MKEIQMKNTMKAKSAFRVGDFYTNEAEGVKVVCVYDGPKCVIIADIRSMKDYTDEVVNEGNECAARYGVFKSIDCEQYIYWGDRETGEDYLTKVTK